MLNGDVIPEHVFSHLSCRYVVSQLLNAHKDHHKQPSARSAPKEMNEADNALDDNAEGENPATEADCATVVLTLVASQVLREECLLPAVSKACIIRPIF